MRSRAPAPPRRRHPAPRHRRGPRGPRRGRSALGTPASAPARATRTRPAAAPLPYLVTSTIVALLATGPGYFLARLIENGGEWNQTVAEIFGDALALPPWRSIR